jgi:hypothetical protein
MGLTRIQGPQARPREKSASQIFKENLARGAGQAIPQVAQKLLGGVIEKSLAPTGAMGRGLMTEEAIRNMELDALASRDHQRALTESKRAEQPTKRYEAAQKTRQEVVKGAAGVEQERTKADAKIKKAQIAAFGQMYQGLKGLNSKDKKVRRAAMEFFYGKGPAEVLSSRPASRNTKKIAKELKAAMDHLNAAVQRRDQFFQSGEVNEDLLARQDELIAEAQKMVSVLHGEMIEAGAASLEKSGNAEAAARLRGAPRDVPGTEGSRKPTIDAQTKAAEIGMEGVKSAESLKAKYADIMARSRDKALDRASEEGRALLKERNDLRVALIQLQGKIQTAGSEVQQYTDDPKRPGLLEYDPALSEELESMIMNLGQGTQTGGPEQLPSAGAGPARIESAGQFEFDPPKSAPAPAPAPAPVGREALGEQAAAPAPVPGEQQDGTAIPEGSTQIPQPRPQRPTQNRVAFVAAHPVKGGARKKFVMTVAVAEAMAKKITDDPDGHPLGEQYLKALLDALNAAQSP